MMKDGITGEHKRRLPLDGAAVEGAIQSLLRHCARCGENFSHDERVRLIDVTIRWDKEYDMKGGPATYRVRFDSMFKAIHHEPCQYVDRAAIAREDGLSDLHSVH